MYTIKNPNPAWKFRNGDYVFHEDESQIDPSSPEGKQIEALWQIQHDTRAENMRHRTHYAWLTYPNDAASRQTLLLSFGLKPDAPDSGPN